MSRRYLAIHLPYWQTDLLRRVQRLPADCVLATWSQDGARRKLEGVNASAERAGLYPGQALADAQALHPDLVLQPADPSADAAALRAMALWARRFTPLTAADPPDGLLLDITGCGYLWGGEAALMTDALTRLARTGITARGAVAGTAATAAALARCRADNPVAVSGIEEQLVAPLPIGPALRPEPGQTVALSRLGLGRIGDLLRQPRGALARRFGPALLDKLDALVGQRPTPLRLAMPPPKFSASREPLEPITTRTSIEAVLDELLAELCERLRQAGQGGRRIGLSAWRVDGVTQTVAIGTALPVRDPAHLRRLFQDKLERLEPGLGFERLALDAWSAEPLSGHQSNLGRDAQMEVLAHLLDRLGQRVTVHRLAPLASHWPEHQQRHLPVAEMAPAPHPGWAAWPAPVLLLTGPRPVDVITAADGTPLALAMQPLARVAGPLRLEAEWWLSANTGLRRDYWRVERASGERLWLYLSEDRWWLHGYLP